MINVEQSGGIWWRGGIWCKRAVETTKSESGELVFCDSEIPQGREGAGAISDATLSPPD